MSKNANRARLKARQLDIDMYEWLAGGLNRPDGRLALFDQFGEPIPKTVKNKALQSGFAKPWFASPMRPQWTVFRLTQSGCDAVARFAATK